MIFRPTDVQLEALKVETCTKAETCAMTAALVLIGSLNLHVVGAAAIVTSANIERLTEEKINAEDTMV